jgi:signal transduction histidine kinase
LLAALLALLVSASVGLVGYLALRQSLFSQAQRQAGDQAAQLRSLVDTTSQGRQRPESGQQGNRVSIGDPSLTHDFARAGLMVSIYRLGGQLIQATDGAAGIALPSSTRAACLEAGQAGARLGQPQLELSCVRVGPASSPVGLIVVGASLHDAFESLNKLATALLIAIAVGSVMSVVLAFVAAQRALRPAREIAATATAISSGDLSRRIRYQGPRDELGGLADLLDAGFAELERGASRQHQFVVDASHQLKTPIAAMRANVELLRDWAGVSPSARGVALSSLDAATRAAARVVGDLLYLAGLERKPANVTSRVRFDQVVLGAMREGQPLRPEVAIRVERLDETEVRGDELRLQQLIVNLLDNALRVSPGDGEVVLALEGLPSTARLTVGDRGPGIPPDQLELIFERFHRADHAGSETRGGGGLGLAIARSIAHEHNGELHAQNRAGGGARFLLELPLTQVLTESTSPS